MPFTDGVTEGRRRRGELSGTARVEALVDQHRGPAADVTDVTDVILADVPTHQHGDARDDIAVVTVAVEWRGTVAACPRRQAGRSPNHTRVSPYFRSSSATRGCGHAGAAARVERSTTTTPPGATQRATPSTAAASASSARS